MITCVCPCGRVYKVPRGEGGTEFSCRVCGRTLRLPMPKGLPLRMPERRLARVLAYKCPCGEVYEVTDAVLGNKVLCPACGACTHVSVDGWLEFVDDTQEYVSVSNEPVSEFVLQHRLQLGEGPEPCDADVPARLSGLPLLVSEEEMQDRSREAEAQRRKAHAIRGGILCCVAGVLFLFADACDQPPVLGFLFVLFLAALLTGLGLLILGLLGG